MLIARRTLKHVAQYSPLLSDHIKRQINSSAPNQPIKNQFSPRDLVLSELPLLLNGQIKLDVPVYTVWGACEDVRVLEKFRSGEYKIPNLHIIDESSSRLLDVGGVKLRLLGLGGAVVMHKLFDNGEGKTSIAGGQGTMWTTLLQMGELVDTANRVYDPAETRIFITHASPAREGMLNQLSVTLKADFSISAGLHFRYGSSYNEFSVNPTLDHYRGKLAASKASFNDVWETVRAEVEQAIGTFDGQKTLLDNALDIVNRMPSSANGGNPFGGPVVGNSAGGQVDESAFKNMWNFNLADAAYGYLVLEVDNGRIGTEMRAQGFNFAHRGGKPSNAPLNQPIPPNTSAAVAPPPAGPAQNRNNQPFPPAAQTSQPQAPKPQPTAPRPAPAPTAPAQTAQVKPLTPQPSSTNVKIPSETAEKSAAASTNGVNTEKPAPAPATATPSRTAEPTASPKQEPSTALFVSAAENEQNVRDHVSEEDKPKIKLVSRVGKYGWMIQFENHDDAKAALDRILEKSKSDKSNKGYKGPTIKFFEDRGGPNRTNTHRDGQGGNAGTWGSTSRGAANANVPSRGGYQSGASDSEGGRGRGGGFGRGRGGRGDRGGRGRGGGRGSFQNKAGGAEGGTESPKPAATAES